VKLLSGLNDSLNAAVDHVENHDVPLLVQGIPAANLGTNEPGWLPSH